MQKVIFYLCLIIWGQTIFCQSDDFKFTGKVASGNYYFLNGTIDRKYRITMRLTVHNWARCGEENIAIQWKNGGIDGWYYYDRIKEKIKIVGSYLNNSEVKLFVPNSPKDTIDAITCDMKNYKEVFWNENDFDVSNMKWKKHGEKEAKDVELKILHYPSQYTIYLIFKQNNKESKTINVSELFDMPEIYNIKIISYLMFNRKYHLLFKLENNSWREYQEYIGHLAIDDNLELKDFNVFLSYDSWKVEKEKLIYNEQHPERGVRMIE
ncbi:MAG TPA: hypothetical protein ENK91_08845 [Bacteroidetes bacterium]|nr:hypothetical protein [Bacteroidota bacterium]